ncbi:MAG: TerB N-terminal domain-containing protein [Sphaerochaetaceae bacterium]|nr:TerB N-terminal domain-containing protein [Sphaerochaetaceae bacterium]
MMRLADVERYAEYTYHAHVLHRGAQWPGFSVITAPGSGEWVAVLIRKRDPATDELTECCDIKCGNAPLAASHEDCLGSPHHMHGFPWIGVRLGTDCEPSVVRSLLSRAMQQASQHGAVVTLVQPALFTETPIPRQEDIPHRIRSMYQIYFRGDGSPYQRWKNFYLMALCMKDYEDDVPWDTAPTIPYPTYYDLSPKAARGYFSWRAKVRNGQYPTAPITFQRIYQYELLNGIGSTTAEGCLELMRRFDEGYYQIRPDEGQARNTLRWWMFGYAVMHKLPAEPYQDVQLKKWDQTLMALSDGNDHEICQALAFLGNESLLRSPVIAGGVEEGEHLFAEAWRKMNAELRLFPKCFGKPKHSFWFPLGGALVNEKETFDAESYQLNPFRSYQYKHGKWIQTAYNRMDADLQPIRSLAHAADRMFRSYLKRGRALKMKEDDGWACSCIQEVIDQDRKEKLAASRPCITIDLSGLSQIRSDSYETRDSLLTESELEDVTDAPVPAAGSSGTALDAPYLQVLATLLAGKDPGELLRNHHLKPSMVADVVNEAFLDRVGDTVVTCEEDRLVLMEDYREDLRAILRNDRA